MKKSGDDGTIPQSAFCIPAWPLYAPSPGRDCGSAQRRDEGGVKYRIPRSAIERPRHQHLRACLETTRGAAARDFGCGQGGEFRASPQRAVRNEPTPATDKRPAARRVFGQKAVWLRPARECFRSCSVVAARSASLVAPAIRPFARKQAPLRILKQALNHGPAVFGLFPRQPHSPQRARTDDENARSGRKEVTRIIACFFSSSFCPARSGI